MPRRVAPIQRVEGSPGVGASSASPTPGCIADTLAVLKADLESHEQRCTELRDLIAGLAVYAANGHAEPPAPPAPPPAKRRRGPAPGPLLSDDERRAKNAAKQRARRDRIRAAASEVAAPAKKGHDASVEAVEPEPQPEPAPEPTDDERLREIASIMESIVAARAEANKFFNMHDRRAHRGKLDEIARLRRRGGFLLKGLRRGVELPVQKDELKAWRKATAGSDEMFEENLAHLSPPIQQLSDWVTDPVDGTLSRTKTAVAAADAAPV